MDSTNVLDVSEFDYSKLRGRIIEKYGTYKAFAVELQLPIQTLSSKLNGVIGITRKDILTWSDRLDITLDEIGVYFFKQKFNNVNTV